MKTLQKTFFSTLLALMVSANLIAQTCFPSAPVCVPSNGYAFQWAGDTDNGLLFNVATTNYEFTNSTGGAVMGINATNGNISIPGGGALQVGPNRYAFQFTLTPNYGLFFNAAGFAYEFRTADASPVVSIGANNGDLDADGNITAGGNLNAPSGNVNTNGDVNATNVNASGTITANDLVVNSGITATSPFGGGGFGVKGIGINGPTNGYLGVQGATDFDGEDSLDNAGDEIGVLGISTGGSSTDNVGVLGFSNDVAVSAVHELNDNQVDLATSGLAIDATGDTRLDGDAEVTGTMGIGTAAPISGLHVSTAGSEMARFISTAGSRWISLYQGTDRKGILWSVGSDMVLRADDPGGDVRFQTEGTDKMRITDAGDVGIGTSAPVSRLHMAYPSGVGNGFTMQNDIDADLWEMYVFSSNDLTLYFNGIQKGSFDDISGTYVPSSDRRYKKNIDALDKKEMMEKILALNPTMYHFNEQSDDDERKYYGLIAQEVKEVIPEIAVYMDESDRYGVSYTELIPVLIAGMQEQNATIEKLEAQNQSTVDQSELIKTVEDLKDEVAQLKQDLSSCCIGMKSDQSINQQINNSVDESWLGQNVPNPFDNTTMIQFYVPESINQATIQVFDLGGRLIKTFDLAKGYGNVKFEDGDLSSGTYVYSLINDGALIATKRMILK